MSRFLFVLLRIQIFAASSSAVVALGAQPHAAVYEIDASTRGNELVSILNTLLPTVAQSVNVPALALQTTLPPILGTKYGSYRGVQYGTIYYIQGITQTTYNTLIIVSYLPTQSTSTIQYVVLPVEQIVELLYFPTLFSTQGTPPGPYASATPPNALIFYSVNPYQRAVDIVSAWQALQKLVTNRSQQVWIQTTVSGPYNPAIPSQGLLQHVTNVSLASNGFLAITFQTLNQTIIQTIYVPPEQVLQLLYIRNFNTPQNY